MKNFLIFWILGSCTCFAQRVGGLSGAANPYVPPAAVDESAKVEEYRPSTNDFRTIDSKLYNIRLSTNWVTLVLPPQNGERIVYTRINAKPIPWLDVDIYRPKIIEEWRILNFPTNITNFSQPQNIRVFPLERSHEKILDGEFRHYRYDYGISTNVSKRK
jgi:hypothetical protein